MSTIVFADARPATILQTVTVDSPSTLVAHGDALYVGCAGKYSSKVGGLFRWEGDATVEIKLAKKAPKVHALLSDGETLWVGASNGLYRVEGDAVSAVWNTKAGLPGKAALSLAKHGDRVFVGCSGGSAWVTDGELEGHKDNTFKNTAHVAVDPAGALWIGSDAALYRVAAGGHDFERLSGYRAVSGLVASSAGVYARLFRGGHESLVMRFDGADADELCDIIPVGVLDDDLLVQSGGLVRAHGEIGKRILFEANPAAYVVTGQRLFGLCNDRVLEIDPASWAKPATVECPTLHSPVTRPRG